MAKNLKSIQRREREREELREQILDVAMSILTKEGYEAVTIRRIADEVEYTPGALYSYFGDKEEIIFALVVRASKKLNALFLSLEEALPHPLERLWATGRAYMRFAMEHPVEYDLMFIMSAPIQKMAECDFNETHTAFRLLRKTVEECMKQGFLPRADADAAAFAMWSFVHGSVSLMIRKRLAAIPEEKYDDVLQGAFNFLMNAMMPRHQEQPIITPSAPKVLAKKKIGKK
ncbi:MAG: TetR/AcrR family transcriptional regulator [Candidatus Kapaibacterium sp.]|nr:MAG: TetR/AcrR family transcriptional regulator [Candidatus Kapabacteria bacterium]